MKSIRYNYYHLLSIKPKGFLITIAIVTLIMGMICHILLLRVYSRVIYYAVYKDNRLYIKVNIDNADTINHGDYLKINNNIYYYQITNISEIMLDENTYVNYQVYELKINESFQENEINKITVYYNRQRIFRKIWKMLI